MVLITSNPSEESQGTQLRVSKKLTTVCSGIRSRFSKPRPNLAISKRGETNIPANVTKTSRRSEPEVAQTVSNLNTDSNDKSSNRDIQTPSSNTDIEKKILNEDTQTQKSSSVIQNVEEDNIEYCPSEDAVKVLDSEEINGVSDSIESQISNTENISPDEESEAISNPETDNTTNDCDIVTSPVKSSGNTTKDCNIVTSPVKSSGSKTTKDCDIAASPVKSSGAPLKSSESEKRSASNITPTVIDKSKYPHLTSILSKKRTEPKKEAQQKRRRKFKKGDAPPERSKMTMADLIYWNPAKTDEPPKSTVTESETPSINVIIEEEENVDDSLESESNIIDSVPKLVISEDGEINIDQSSLFVSRNIPQPTTTEVVRKDDTTYSSFRKRPLTKHWTAKDTANFYRALSLVGADFSLMEQIFPNRTRRELKQKFKREEKFNIDLINKVLYESETFDELSLNAFIDQNNTVDEPEDSTNNKDVDAVIKEKSRKKRTSKKTQSTNKKTCDTSVDDLVEEITLENENAENKKKKKKKAKKLSDDEDVHIVIPESIQCSDTGELKSSKRKRTIRKLPDDFINLDAVEELDVWGDDESNNQEILDASEKENAGESQENGNNNETEKGNSLETENDNNIEAENDAEEISSESACVILDKIMNGTEIIDSKQNLKDHHSGICDAAVSLPTDKSDNKEYIVEYIKNDDSEADICMLSDVVAYEVVNTQTAPLRKRRKLNSISPQKVRDHFLSTKICCQPPTNYTNYTPV